MNRLQNSINARRNSPAVVTMAPTAGAGPPAEASDRAKDMAEALRLHEIIISQSGVQYGVDEVIDLNALFDNPDPGAAGATVYTMMSFTVPAGLIARIDRISCLCSEPLFAINSLVLGWRPEIDGNKIPYYTGHVVGFAGFVDWHLLNEPSIHPSDREPLWIQSQQTLAVRLVKFAFMDNPFSVIGRISGRLYKPANPIGGRQ